MFYYVFEGVLCFLVLKGVRKMVSEGRGSFKRCEMSAITRNKVYTVYIRCGPLPVTVTTVTGRGPHPKYTCKLNIKKVSFDLQLAAVVHWELFSRRQRYFFNF